MALKECLITECVLLQIAFLLRNLLQERKAKLRSKLSHLLCCRYEWSLGSPEETFPYFQLVLRFEKELDLRFTPRSL